jgi:hypothetical protein
MPTFVEIHPVFSEIKHADEEEQLLYISPCLVFGPNKAYETG